MTAINRKLLYALVVLLFLLVIALIGWLVSVLFSFRIEPPTTAPAPVVTVKHQHSQEGPLSETVIDIEALPEPAAAEVAPVDAIAEVADVIGHAGHIPAICEGYGPQLRGREAFFNPLTHETVVSATRAVVTLTLPPSIPRGDQ